MNVPVPRRAYWICQLLGWSSYGAVNAVVFMTVYPKLATAASLLTTCALGATFSHLYRRVIHRRGWLRLGLFALLPRVVAVSLALGLALEVSGMAAGRMILPASAWSTTSAAGYLVYAFNFSIVFFGWQLIYFGVHLFERSRKLEIERWQLQEAELRYLKAQINPHFLFNCLNSLRALILEDAGRAQAMVTRLASLLRYALGTAHDQLVPLERELAVVQDYLALEGTRFESRLRTRFEVAPESREVRVPPMLVQMLVENGIKHGIARLRDGGEIVVSAAVADGHLELTVTNTAASAPAEGEGIGLANARERLHLLYGERAALRLDRSSPRHTTASLRIPVS